MPDNFMSERLIPLRIADQAVAACNAEIAKLQEHNTRLKAEVDRLEMEQKLKAVPVDAKLFDRVAELQAQAERLIKAGDAMIPLLGKGNYAEARHEWNAAKKGESK